MLCDQSNSIHLQAKLAKLRRELLEPSTGAGAGGGGKGEGVPSFCDVSSGTPNRTLHTFLSPVICYSKQT